MLTIGIICEYNPFHNGHTYHIKKIKEKYPNSLIVLCLNGLFLERGEISILTKEEKTLLALKNGVDLVVNLPTIYGVQSADKFAYAAIKILSSLNVQKIIFGSELNDIEKLKDLSHKTMINKKRILKNETKKGYSYSRILRNLTKENNINPNDILGISYCKAVNELDNTIELETIKRTSNYYDTKSTSPIISATNIREKIKNNENITAYIPNYEDISFTNISYDKLYMILKHKILTTNNLNTILDINEGIENKLKKDILKSSNIEEFIKCIKSKRYTINHIQRMLIHIYLGLEKKDATPKIEYIKILGYNEIGLNYLKQNKHNFKLQATPIKNNIIYNFELLASYLYDLITDKNTYEFEQKNIPLYINTASFNKESNQK